MNKKNITLFITTFVFTIIVFLLVIFNINGVYAEEKRNPDSYWSEENAPVFYGATKIQFSNVYTNSFDLLDARFRIFATDFEDGDLTTEITHEGSVDINTPGTYEITYKVKDSHNNETTLVVPVIITNEDTKEMIIERTMYTNPNTDNITKTGINRSTFHDRQMLGIFLPDGKSFYMKTIDSDYDISVHFDNRASSCEGASIKALKNGDEVEFRNNKTGCQNLVAYAPLNQEAGTPITLSSIPFAYTVNLPKEDTPVNKTLKVQLRFNIDEVLPLDYYHYKDDFDSFLTKWQTSGNLYGLVDSERIQILIPLDNISKYNAFQFNTIDALLEYYNKVITRYDDYIGLEINPEELTNQNVRVKYFIKPNKNGAGAAYYGNDHVAVNSQNMFSFFERNWGGLHEIAHGYQGSLGNGSMNLGEVSNNVLGHYAQIDKSIFDDNLDWLGKLPDIEETMIRTRDAYLVATPEEMAIEPLKGNIFKMKLYTLINLFDSYEGPTTFKKLNRWYRSEINKGKTMKNEDAYITFMANEYNVNLIPYFEGYNFFASPSVVDEILSRNLSPINSLGDIITNEDARNTFMAQNNMNLKYGVVSNNTLKLSNIKSSLNLSIDIDNIDNLLGKKLYIKSGTQIIKSEDITSKNMTINDLPLGTFILQMPVLTGYTQDYAYVNISDSENNANYKYTLNDDYDFGNYLVLKIKGNSNTYGYTMTFSDNYKKAQISFGGALIGANSGAYVKILDKDLNEISYEEAKYISKDGGAVYDEDGPYFNFKKQAFTLDLEVGTIIEVKRPTAANRVLFFSTYNNTNNPSDAISGYEPTGTITRYIVEDGYLRREDLSEEAAQDQSYNTLKNHLTEIIDDYQNTVTTSVINNRNLDFKSKSLVISAYSKLRNEDKETYSDFISSLINGGSPKITYKGKNTYKKEDTVNLIELVEATDPEDGSITINESNTKVETNLDLNTNGVYTVKYTVKDLDLNESSLEVEITVNNPIDLGGNTEESNPIEEKLPSPKTEEKIEKVTQKNSDTKTNVVTPPINIVKEENTTINEEITTNDFKKTDNEIEEPKQETIKKKKNKINFKKILITSLIIIGTASGLLLLSSFIYKLNKKNKKKRRKH